MDFLRAGIPFIAALGAVAGSSSGAQIHVSARVGIQDLNGDSSGRNLQWAFDQHDVITDEEAILFSPVPEPGMLLLLGSSLVGLGFVRGRQRRRK